MGIDFLIGSSCREKDEIAEKEVSHEAFPEPKGHWTSQDFYKFLSARTSIPSGGFPFGGLGKKRAINFFQGQIMNGATGKSIAGIDALEMIQVLRPPGKCTSRDDKRWCDHMARYAVRRCVMYKKLPQNEIIEGKDHRGQKQIRPSSSSSPSSSMSLSHPNSHRSENKGPKKQKQEEYMDRYSFRPGSKVHQVEHILIPYQELTFHLRQGRLCLSLRQPGSPLIESQLDAPEWSSRGSMMQSCSLPWVRCNAKGRFMGVFEKYDYVYMGSQPWWNLVTRAAATLVQKMVHPMILWQRIGPCPSWHSPGISSRCVEFLHKRATYHRIQDLPPRILSFIKEKAPGFMEFPREEESGHVVGVTKVRGGSKTSVTATKVLKEDLPNQEL